MFRFDLDEIDFVIEKKVYERNIQNFTQSSDESSSDLCTRNTISFPPQHDVFALGRRQLRGGLKLRFEHQDQDMFILFR